MEVDVYVEERIRPRLKWYDKRAVTAKRIYMLSQYVSVLLSVAIIILLEFEAIPRSVLASLAAMIAFVVVGERIGQFGRQWQLYRLASELLASELEMFRYQVGPYTESSMNGRRLVERTEALLRQEAAQWNSLVEDSHAGTNRGLPQIH